MLLVRVYQQLLMAAFAGVLAAGPAIAGGFSNGPSGASDCTGLGAGTRCFFDNQLWGAQNSGAPWTVEGIRPGDLRFEVRSGDIASLDVQNNHRAERTELSQSRRGEPTQSDIWLSLGLMVEPGPPVTSRWLVLGQFKAKSDFVGGMSGSPAWAQELDAGDLFRIVARTSPQYPLIHNPAPIVLFVDPGFQRGRVYHFVYHFRYSQTNGRLEAWRDGRKIVDYRGPLGFVGKQPPYFKFGIYREPAPETVAVHFYNVQIGGQELKP